ncbi:hypothetical protein OQA88_9179 [Cercophora sp. LCS_1]
MPSGLAIIWLFLCLTPVLWNPTNWLIWLSFGLQVASEMAYVPDYDLLNDFGHNDVAGRCMSYEAKRNATVVEPVIDDVSGWYGPGAYLAWLVTAYVASVSSIWHSKCAVSEALRERVVADEGFPLPRWGSAEPADVVDGVMFAALAYPVVALLDVFVRLVRCKVDAQMSAAVFVLFSALVVFGPTARLSWQVDGVEFEPVFFPATNRSWAWKGCALLVHGFVVSLIGEPYAYTRELLIPVYVMLFVVMLYAPVHGERLSEEYPYRTTVYRPRVERVVVFGLVQVIFFAVSLGKVGSVVPVTGASLWDMDQIGALVVTVITLIVFNSYGFGFLLTELRRRWQGWRRIARTESIELHDCGDMPREVIVDRSQG